MTLCFKKMVIDNFLSFEHAELLFNEKGYTIVSGKNENPNDNAKSNGSGKSALFEALSWVLTGETIRGSKDVVNIYTNGTATVELDFQVDKDEFTLIRTKNPSNLKLYINGIDKSAKGIKDTSKIVEQYLPDLTSQLIGSVIILGQGLPQRFTNNTPAGRKEVLEKLFKTDFMIADIKERIAKRQQILSDKNRKIEDTILSLSSNQQLLESQLNQAKSELEYYDSTNCSVLEDSIKTYTKNIEEIESKIEEQTIELNQYNEDLNKGMNKLSNLSSQYSDEISKFGNKHTIESKMFEDEEAEQKSNIKSLEAEINKLKSIKDICPTCGRKLDGVNKPDTTKQEEELKLLNEKYNKHTIDYNNFRDKLAQEKTNIDDKFNSEINETKKSNSSLQANIEIFNRNIAGLNKEKSEYERKINEAQVFINTFNNKVSSLNDTIINHSKNIEEIKDKIIYNNTEKDNLQYHIDVVTKMNTLSIRDFRGYLLSDIIAQIDMKAKEYCNIVFGTDLIDFELDGNNISIKYSDKEYENLSSGERAKVDIIVQFSIRASLASSLGFSSNVLVLDEVFDALDASGCENVINLIATQLSDVENVFIVTHRGDLELPADNYIQVVKKSNGISSID